MNGTEEIGCCGAYCKTCREFRKTCKGCKPGYLDGSRDLQKARCKMKVCCLTEGNVTCADCAEYSSCETIQRFVQHPGYKYSKYHQALEFIRAHDYQTFLAVAQNWKTPTASMIPGNCRGADRSCHRPIPFAFPLIVRRSL